MIEIEKNVPLPTRSARGPAPKYPWADMAVGDSFVMPVKYMSAHGQAVRAAAKYGFKFTIRKLDEEQTRIWRVE